MSIDQAVHAWVSSKRRRSRARKLTLPLAVVVVLLMLFVVASGTVRAQDATNPTAADYVAAKNRVAMARVEAELAKIQRDAKGEGQSQGQGNTAPSPYANYAQSMVRAPAPVEPTVQRVKARSDGTLIAMIALGNGTVIPAWAGKSLGRGLVVESVTTSDVIVKDGSGVHPLAWGDGSSSSSNLPVSVAAPPGGIPMSGGLTPPPVAGN